MIKYIRDHIHIPGFVVYIAILLIVVGLGLKIVFQDGKFVGGFIGEQANNLTHFLGVNNKDYNFKPQVAGTQIISTGEKFNIPKNYNIPAPDDDNKLSPFAPPQINDIKSINISVINYSANINQLQQIQNTKSSGLVFECNINCNNYEQLISGDLIEVVTAQKNYYYEITGSSDLINPEQSIDFAQSKTIILVYIQNSSYRMLEAKLI